MKNYLKIAAVAVALLSASEVKAQSLKDFLNSDTVKDVVENVAGSQPIDQNSVSGEWIYAKPSVKLASDNILSAAAGTALSKQAEAKLETYCTKFGVVKGQFKFNINSDSSFSFELKGKKLSGTYTVDSKTNMIKFDFKAIQSINLASIEAEASLNGDSLSLLFDANKVLDIIKSLGSKVNDSTVKTLTSVLNSYKDILLGFEFTKTPGTGATNSTTDNVKNALTNLFGR